MLELGATRRASTPSSPSRSLAAGVDLVFTVGAEMRALYDALPQHVRGGHAATAADDGRALLAALCAPATS